MKTHKQINPFFVYISTSFLFGLIVVYLALGPSDKWHNFLNSKPLRGEMGFGRFVIRGARIINGVSTPFAYPWRRIDPTTTGRLTAWLGYIIHQFGQWFILARVQLSKKKQLRWSEQYQWWNWQMVYLNVAMAIFKLIHGHVFYDGLSTDVPEGIAQGSVVMILVAAILMAIPRRGVIFGLGRKPKSAAYNEVIDFAKKYHGYMMSFGTVGNFHYHPVEGTLGHFFGFVYQCLLIWQSTNFLHKSHRNKSWVLLLEIWVFIHGSLTALIQPGIGWQIFSYGFMAMFLLNQIYQTHVGQHKGILIGLYGLFAGWMYWGFRQDKKYFRATFIPVAEYMCLYFCIGIGMMTSVLLRYVPARQHKQWIIISTYIGVSIVLTIGLAYVLAGNLLVYNDY